MKKSLLFLAAALLSVSASAQLASKPAGGLLVKSPVKVARTDKALFKGSVSATRKAPINTQSALMTYMRPTGSFYSAGYVLTTIVVPPFSNIELQGYSTYTPMWRLEGQDITSYSTNQQSSNGLNVSTLSYGTPTLFPYPYLSAGNNRVESVNPVPFFANGTGAGKDSCNLGDLSSGWDSYHISAFETADSFSYISNYDPTYAWAVGGTDGAYPFAAAFGEDKVWPDYLFGSMTMVDTTTNTTHKGSYVMQIFDKPASTLCVNDIEIPAISFSTMFTGDKKLNLDIIKLVESTGANGQTTYSLGDVIASYTAGANDTTGYQKGLISWLGKTVEFAQINFVNHSVNEDGIEVVKPTYINDPFVIRISGFDQDGVDVGLYGGFQNNYDRIAGFSATQAFSDGQSWDWNGFCVPALYLNAIFDGISVTDSLTYQGQTYSNLNRYVIPTTADANGQYLASSELMGSPMIYTAMPWNDAVTGEENYTWKVKSTVVSTDGTSSFEETDYVPDWLNVSVSDDNRIVATYTDANGQQTQNYGNGEEDLTIESTALPSGVKGRVAALTAVGKGVESNAPIIVTQGDVTEAQIIATGINKVNANDAKAATDNRVFNLAGQQVTKAYKGIVISNGKKYIQK